MSINNRLHKYQITKIGCVSFEVTHPIFLILIIPLCSQRTTNQESGG